MNNVDIQFKCTYCINNKYIEFQNSIDFLKHLKTRHCFIDNNNNYLCLYGLNSTCQYLNSNCKKLTQQEYDEHVFKTHLMSSSKQQQQLIKRATSSSSNGYESFK